MCGVERLLINRYKSYSIIKSCIKATPFCAIEPTAELEEVYLNKFTPSLKRSLSRANSEPCFAPF